MIKYFISKLDFDQKARDEFIDRMIVKYKPGKILDLGAGGGPYSNKLIKAGFEYVSQDYCQLNNELIREGEYRVIDIVCNAECIPVNDESFDYVICTEVLEHVENPDLILAEISRVLKRDGIFLLTIPQMAPAHQRPYWFTSGFSIEWIKNRFEKNNFEILNISYPFGAFANLFKLKIANLIFTTKRTWSLPILAHLLLLVMLPFMMLSLIIDFFSMLFLNFPELENGIRYGHLVEAKKFYFNP
jgi:ubiquinone/menaquinone biosynthesis C-methylase UbiE